MRITAAKLLIIITVIIFLFTMLDTTAVYNSNPFGSQDCCPRNSYGDFCDTDKCAYETCCEYTYTDYNFALIPHAFFERPWTLITSMFLHTGYFHVILNMLALALFGIYLEKVVGWKNFLLIYFIGGIIGSIAYVLFAAYLKEAYIPAVGASGAVYAVIITLMIIRPYDEILKAREKGFFYDVFWVYLFGFLGFMPLFFVGLIFIAVALSGLLIDFMLGGQSGVANAAHLGGAAAGIIFGLYFRSCYAADSDVETPLTSSDEKYQKIAREEKAKLVRINRFGKYEYVDKGKDEDKLEIAGEKQREPEQIRQKHPSDKGSDDELEIIR